MTIVHFITTLTRGTIVHFILKYSGVLLDYDLSRGGGEGGGRGWFTAGCSKGRLAALGLGWRPTESNPRLGAILSRARLLAGEALFRHETHGGRQRRRQGESVIVTRCACGYTPCGLVCSSSK